MPTCMCASTQPGNARRPFPSTVSFAFSEILFCTSEKRPSWIPISIVSTPFAFGRTTRTFLMTRSSMLRCLPQLAAQVAAVALRADDLVVVHHGDAAHDGAHRPALQLPAVVKAVVGIGLELLPLHLAHLVQVDEREIGVSADRDAALGRTEVEDARRAGGDDVADALERQASLVIALREQHRQDRGDAG